jgi:hypothetical protein
VADSPDQKQHPESTKEGAGDQARSTFNAAMAAAVDPEQNSKPVQEKWWKQPEHIIQVFILLFVAFYTILTFCLLQTSKDTEMRQLRAYIGAGPDKIIRTADGNWAIQIAAHNYGQTPARSVQINGGWELLDFPKGKEIVATHHFAYLRTEESSGLDVYPTKDGTAALPPFSPDDMKEMQGYAGPLKLYGAGVVTYEDVFGNLQRTDYCFILRLRDIGTLVALGKPGEITSFDWCVIRYNRAT